MSDSAPSKIVIPKNFKKVSDALEKRYGKYVHQEFDEFMECMMYQILALGTTPDAANVALSDIHDEFVNWNDMRMASVREIQDILGDSYVRCREKSEDVINLLADLYTAFHRMNIAEIIPTDDGIMTLRALPRTTLLRRDMVELALHEVYGIPAFGCDPDHFVLLQFLGGINKKLSYDEGMEEILLALVEERISVEELRNLSHGLQCHADFLAQHEIFDPKAIAYGWNKTDPLGMKVAKFKSLVSKPARIEPVLPKPKPILNDDAAATAQAAPGKGKTKAKEAEAELAKLSEAMPEGKNKNAKPQIVVVAKGAEDSADSNEAINAAIEKADAPSDDPEAQVETEKIEATKTTNKKVAVKKATVKKTTAKKSATSKKVVAKKTTVKKAPAKKAEIKKSEIKKVEIKKSEIKKAVIKKAASKKVAPVKTEKKTVVKKTAVKKTAAKKVAPKKTPVKKTAAKKTTAKKPATKKAPKKK